MIVQLLCRLVDACVDGQACSIQSTLWVLLLADCTSKCNLLQITTSCHLWRCYATSATW